MPRHKDSSLPAIGICLGKAGPENLQLKVPQWLMGTVLQLENLVCHQGRRRQELCPILLPHLRRLTIFFLSDLEPLARETLDPLVLLELNLVAQAYAYAFLLPI